jgi:ribosomal-protein-alanine N-acetyltransferase
MNWFKIRKATAEDAPAIAEIEKLCFAAPWAEGDLARDIGENILASYTVAITKEKNRHCERSEAIQTRKDCPETGLPRRSAPRNDESNDKLVAYGGIWVVLDEGHIMNIAVHPDYRRGGLASMILLEMLKGAREKGATRFTLEVRKSNEPAIALYERFGFKKAGYRKGYYKEENEDALIMWKIDE